jgi:hypothetical protein
MSDDDRQREEEKRRRERAGVSRGLAVRGGVTAKGGIAPVAPGKRKWAGTTSARAVPARSTEMSRGERGVKALSYHSLKAVAPGKGPS